MPLYMDTHKHVPGLTAEAVVRLVAGALAMLSLAVVPAWAGLIAGQAHSDGQLRYARAARLAPPELRWDTGLGGQVRLHSVYHTPDSWTQVLSWYARQLRLDLDRRPRLRGNCFHFAQSQARLFIQQNIAATVCSDAAGTTIFMERSLSLRY